MVVDGLSFEGLDFALELLLFHVVVVLLCVRPILYPLGLFFVVGELFLLQILIFVHLRVLHLELRHVVSCFVLVCLQVQLHDGTVPDRQGLSLLHLLEAFCFDGV